MDIECIILITNSLGSVKKAVDPLCILDKLISWLPTLYLDHSSCVALTIKLNSRTA